MRTIPSRGELADEQGPAWRQLLVLLSPVFAVSLGYGAVLPVLPSLLQRLYGTSADEALPLHAGLLTGLYIGAFSLGAPLWGRLTDRRGSRIVFLVGLIGYAAATVWFGLARSIDAAYFARFVAGASAAGLLPATAAWIALHATGDRRVRQLAWMNAVTGIGFLLGPALTGWTHDVLTMFQSPAAAPDSTHLTVVPIWLAGAVALVAAAAVARGLKRQASDASESAGLRSAAQPANTPRHLRLLSALSAFGLGAFEVGLTLQNASVWRWSASELAGLFGVCSLVMLVVQLVLFAPLRRRVESRTLVVTGLVAMTVGLALLSETSGYTGAVALVAAIALGSGLIQPTLSVAVADTSGQAVGRATGLQNAAGNLGQAAGSAAAGALFGARLGHPFVPVAVVMLVTAIGAAWSVR